MAVAVVVVVAVMVAVMAVAVVVVGRSNTRCRNSCSGCCGSSRGRSSCSGDSNNSCILESRRSKYYQVQLRKVSSYSSCFIETGLVRK